MHRCDAPTRASIKPEHLACGPEVHARPHSERREELLRPPAQRFVRQPLHLIGAFAPFLQPRQNLACVVVAVFRSRDVGIESVALPLEVGEKRIEILPVRHAPLPCKYAAERDFAENDGTANGQLLIQAFSRLADDVAARR